MKKRNIIIITTTTILLVLGLIITLSLVLTLNRYKTMDVKINGEFETGKPIKILEDSFLEKHNVDKVKLNLEIDIKNTKIELSERIKNGLIPVEKVKKDYNWDFDYENLKLRNYKHYKTDIYYNYSFKPYFFYNLNKTQKFIFSNSSEALKIRFFLYDNLGNKYYFIEKEKNNNILFLNHIIKKNKFDMLIFDYEIEFSFYQVIDTKYNDRFSGSIRHFRSKNSIKITYKDAYEREYEFNKEYPTFKDFKKDYIIKSTFSNQNNIVYYK